MTTCVALLRGINIGGRNRLAMADLRRLSAESGAEDAQTYIQSGNLVFSTVRTDLEALGEDLTSRIAAGHGFAPLVIVRTAAELAAIVATNPYRDEAEADPSKVHVAVLATDVPTPLSPAIAADEGTREELTEHDGVLYLHLPEGMGRSRLVERLARHPAGARMTIRNWRTITTLDRLAHAHPSTA